MSEKKYARYIEKVRYRTKIFAPYQSPILDLYQVNDFQRLEKSAIYDYLEEKLGSLPGTERSFRNYINYLIETEQLKLNGNKRIYSPVAELLYGKQLQIDFGEYRTKSKRIMGSGLETTYFFKNERALMKNMSFQDLNFPSEKSR